MRATNCEKVKTRLRVSIEKPARKFSKERLRDAYQNVPLLKLLRQQQRQQQKNYQMTRVVVKDSQYSKSNKKKDLQLRTKCFVCDPLHVQQHLVTRPIILRKVTVQWPFAVFAPAVQSTNKVILCQTSGELPNYLCPVLLPVPKHFGLV